MTLYENFISAANCKPEVAKSSKSREPILLSKIKSLKNPKKIRGNFKKLKYGRGP
jgi:hypothetical protein